MQAMNVLLHWLLRIASSMAMITTTGNDQPLTGGDTRQNRSQWYTLHRSPGDEQARNECHIAKHIHYKIMTKMNLRTRRMKSDDCTVYWVGLLCEG
jgi:hypothetical protein